MINCQANPIYILLDPTMGYVLLSRNKMGPGGVMRNWELMRRRANVSTLDLGKNRIRSGKHKEKFSAKWPNRFSCFFLLPLR